MPKDEIVWGFFIHVHAKGWAEERGHNEVVATANEHLANLLEKPALLVCGMVIPHITGNKNDNFRIKHIVNYYSAVSFMAYCLKRVSSQHVR
jgi:hypothetical protein